MRVYCVRVQVEKTVIFNILLLFFSCIPMCGFLHRENYELYLLVWSLGSYAEGYDQFELSELNADMSGGLLLTVTACF